MGYDMTLEAPVQGEEEAMAKAQAVFDAAMAARDALPPEAKGSWYTEAERAADEITRREIATVHLAEVERLQREGVDFYEARLRAGSVPATEEYLEAHRAVMAADDLRDAAHSSYFRLNIWGMSKARDVMARFGMLKEGQQPWPEAPVWQGEDAAGRFDWLQTFFWGEEGGYKTVEDTRTALAAYVPNPQNEWETPAPEFSDEEIQSLIDYFAANEEAKTAHDRDTPGIAVHKLGSNDGWLVTPSECRTALDAYQRACLEIVQAQGALEAAEDEASPAITAEVEVIGEVEDETAVAVVEVPKTEGQLAVEAVNALLVPEYPWWPSWLQFIAHGAEGKGFRVY